MDYRKWLEQDESHLDALANAKLAKLTPKIKRDLVRVGYNQYTIPKIAEHVVWRVVSKMEDDGKEAYYLTRINNNNDGHGTKKKAAEDSPTFTEGTDKERKLEEQTYNKSYSEVLVDKFELLHGALNIVPTNCPGKGKDQNLMIGDDGAPCCMLQGKPCPHLQDFSMTVLAGDKTINCGIK